MFGSLIKLVFKSFADNSGISKWNESVKSSVGNMGHLSRAAQMLGATMGTVGGAIGRLVGALAQGSVWGVASQGVAMLIERLDLFGRKAEEARNKNEELAETARRAYADANANAAKAIENINKELQARKAIADIFDRQYKAELQLRRAEALRSGDLSKAQNIEAEIANADRQSAVGRAEAEAIAAEKAVAEAKRALDAANKRARDAMKRESDAEATLAEMSKPVTMTMQSSAGAFTYTQKRDTTEAQSNLKTARKDVEAADAEVDKARAAYDIEVEKWRLARANAKAVADEQEAAAEKEFAERLAAEKKAVDEHNKAERKRLIEQQKRDAEAAKKAAEAAARERQRQMESEAAERQRVEREMLQSEQKANTDRANDLRDKLKKAQADAAAAFDLFRDPSQIDQAGERRAKRQKDIDQARLAENAINLQQRKDWRTARLSNRDEATRRWLLAKENEGKVKNEQKEVVDKLDKIKTLLEAATTL